MIHFRIKKKVCNSFLAYTGFTELKKSACSIEMKKYKSLLARLSHHDAMVTLPKHQDVDAT